MNYRIISPAKGIDGNWYIDANGGPNFAGSHLDFERERGNLFPVKRVGVSETEEDIPDGALVCFTAFGCSLWEEIK